MRKRHLLALAPAAFLAACSGADPDEAIATIRQTEQIQLHALESGDLVGVARLYSDDAQLVRPDGTVLQGGVAIVEDYDRLMADPNFAISIEPRDGWASASGDLAVVTSNVSFATSDPQTGERVRQPLRSTTTWTRDSGASWKIVSTYNVAVSPTTPAEAGPQVASAGS